MIHLPRLGLTTTNQKDKTTQRPTPLPLDSKKHNPAHFQHLDLRGKFDKEKQDVLLGRVQWSLENQLQDPNFKGSRKNIEKAIAKLQQARSHLKRVPNDKISSGDIAILEKALIKAANASPKNSSQQRTMTMLADYMSLQWGKAYTNHVAGNVANEQRFLRDDGAKKTESKSISAGAAANLGPANIGGNIGLEKNTFHSVDYNGAHIHQVEKKHFGQAKLGVNGGLGHAEVSGEAAYSKVQKQSEVYAGGTQEYIKKEGYKQFFGSKRADARIAKMRVGAGLDSSVSTPKPTTQMENSATAALMPEYKKAKFSKPVVIAGAIKNDLSAHAKTHQKVANQESLLKAMLSSELGLDVEFPVSEANQIRTKMKGRKLEASVSANATFGAHDLSGKLSASAGAQAKIKFAKIDNSYVKYEPIWEVLKNQENGSDVNPSIAKQRTNSVLEKAQSHAKHHTHLFPNADTNLMNASPEELLQALDRLEGDVANYVSHKKMLNRPGPKSYLSDTLKSNIKEIEHDYGISGPTFKRSRKGESFIKASTLIHAAIGAQLLKQGSANANTMAKLDGLSQKLRSPDIPVNQDHLLESTHFASQADVKSSTTSSKFSLNYGVELPSLGQGMPGTSKAKGISVEIERIKQPEHPDPLSRGETINVTVGVPSVTTPDLLEKLASSAAKKMGMPDAADAILVSLTNAISVDTSSDGKLSLAMKFSKPTLKGEQDKKFKLEYATARVAVQSSHIRANLGATGGALPTSLQLGLRKEKVNIVPIATFYGEGSLKNIIRAYNTTQISDPKGEDNSWAEQKARRQPALDRILLSMNDPQSSNRKMVDDMFDDAIINAPENHVLKISNQQKAFLSLTDQIPAASRTESDLKALTDKMNIAFEELLALQHDSWLAETSDNMRPQPYD